MQKKRKKFWLGFGIVCAAIVVLCSVFALVTRTKTVVVWFTSRVPVNSQLEKGIQDKVKESGDFPIGKSLLFANLNECVDKIEKSNPYVKVESIVRHFPNVVRVYISEREPRFRIKDKTESSKWYILDEDFKVVDIVTGDIKGLFYGVESYYDNTIEITQDSLKISSYIGGFVHEEFEQNCANTIVQGVEKRSTEFSVVKSIELQKVEGDYNVVLTMKNSGINDDDGCVIVIQGLEDLKLKVYAGVSCFYDNENDFEVDKSSLMITIYDLGNGNYEGRVTQKV